MRKRRVFKNAATTTKNARKTLSWTNCDSCFDVSIRKTEQRQLECFRTLFLFLDKIKFPWRHLEKKSSFAHDVFSNKVHAHTIAALSLLPAVMQFLLLNVCTLRGWSLNIWKRNYFRSEQFKTPSFYISPI